MSGRSFLGNLQPQKGEMDGIEMSHDVSFFLMLGHTTS
jgi:hypothetical protein